MIKSSSHRLWYIDFVRGLAIIGMIVYHLIFDLYLLGQSHLNPFSPPLIVFARLVASLFLFLVGASFFLSARKYPHHHRLFVRTLKRSLIIFLAASLVSLVTFLINPGLTVRFGILHLVAVSLLLLLPLSLVRSTLLLTVIALIFLLVPQPPPALPTFDYYPLFPWFGIVILGYLSAHYLPTGKQTPPSPLIKPFLFLGRHSLIAYLFHQPILIFFLYLPSRFSTVYFRLLFLPTFFRPINR